MAVARLNGIDLQFDCMKASLGELHSKLKRMATDRSHDSAKVNRTIALYKEMEARNKCVWDDYMSLNDRISILEGKTDET